MDGAKERELQLSLVQLIHDRLHATSRIPLHRAKLQQHQQAEDRDATEEQRAFHELLNDTCATDVLATAMAWVDRLAGPPATTAR